MWDDIKVTVPEGESGNWRIERVTVSKEDERLERLHAAFSYDHRYVPAGTYTRLIRGGTTVMSDTPDEIGDHWELFYNAGGEVLINGLGLGVALMIVMAKECVAHVTVIELDSDVIALVGPHYKKLYGDRLTIINANAFTWQPPKGKRYNAVWHDIWDNICADNLDEMHTLHRKYGRRCDWQGSWCRHLCERDR